jgi:SAM-dependent methyltransferase
MRTLDIEIMDYSPSAEAFRAFQAENYFSGDYYGGRSSAVWDEKLLEHWIASERLGLNSFTANDVYIDVAAASSPWAHEVRARKGIEAYAIDLGEVGEDYRNLPYYRIENATATSFPNASVKGASLHCAYEMFVGNDDVQFIREIARILEPGGRVLILPLYMHTHYCAYSTPEYFGKGFSDPKAKEYVRLDCIGVPSSRKYSAAMLKKRVLDIIVSEGMSYSLLALRNKSELGEGIYCHFILEICK